MQSEHSVTAALLNLPLEPTACMQAGQPAIFITHGTGDQVLPMERCSRRLVPRLKDMGYDLTYTEFEGPDTVLPSSAKDAMQWFLQACLAKRGALIKKAGEAIVAEVDI